MNKDIPKESKPEDRTILIHVHSSGHYPDEFLKVSQEEHDFIAALDSGKSALYDVLRTDVPVSEWFEALKKSRAVNLPSFCEYC